MGKRKEVPAMKADDVMKVDPVKYLERCTFMVTGEELKRLKIDSINSGHTLSNYLRSIIFGKV